MNPIKAAKRFDYEADSWRTAAAFQNERIPGRLESWLLEARWRIHGRFRRILGRTVCRWRGHDLVDAGSYATPDSGAEHLDCSRCDYSFNHIYY